MVRLKRQKHLSSIKLPPGRHARQYAAGCALRAAQGLHLAAHLGDLLVDLLAGLLDLLLPREEEQDVALRLAGVDLHRRAYGRLQVVPLRLLCSSTSLSTATRLALVSCEEEQDVALRLAGVDLHRRAYGRLQVVPLWLL